MEEEDVAAEISDSDLQVETAEEGDEVAAGALHQSAGDRGELDQDFARSDAHLIASLRTVAKWTDIAAVVQGLKNVPQGESRAGITCPVPCSAGKLMMRLGLHARALTGTFDPTTWRRLYPTLPEVLRVELPRTVRLFGDAEYTINEASDICRSVTVSASSRESFIACLPT